MGATSLANQHTLVARPTWHRWTHLISSRIQRVAWNGCIELCLLRFDVAVFLLLFAHLSWWFVRRWSSPTTLSVIFYVIELLHFFERTHFFLEFYLIPKTYLWTCRTAVHIKIFYLFLKIYMFQSLYLVFKKRTNDIKILWYWYSLFSVTEHLILYMAFNTWLWSVYVFLSVIWHYNSYQHGSRCK